MRPFSELVVVEIAGSVAGAYAGKLFSDFGAKVLKVEPPGGDPARWTGALTQSGVSAAFEYLNTGKSSVAIDANTATGRGLLRELSLKADVIIESFSPGPAAPLADEITAHATAIRVRISPFGLEGTYRDHRSTPFTDFAVGGHMYLTGEPDREPLQGAPDQPLYAAGTHAYVGALAALIAREQTGRGQDIDVSHFEVMASLHQWTTVRYTHGGIIQTRVGNRYGSLHPSTIYECKDGYVAFGAVGNEPLRRFLSLVGMEELLEDERFRTGSARFANADAFDAIIEPWMRQRSVMEVVELGQSIRAAVAPVNDLSDLLSDPHLNAREFWQRPADSSDETYYPGPPFRMSGHDWRLRLSPAISGSATNWLGELTGSSESLQEAGAARHDPHD